MITAGEVGEMDYLQGLLNIGEAMSPPVIRALKAVRAEADLVIVDAPPGTSCPVVEAVRGCDKVLLVTEPTPFGLHDLELALDTVGTPRNPVRGGHQSGRCSTGMRRGKLCRSRGVEIAAGAAGQPQHRRGLLAGRNGG